PSFFAYAIDASGKLAGRTGVYYLGLATVLVPLVAGVSALRSAITRYRDITTMIGGLIINGLGVMIIFGRGFALG
ncbi:cytochrome c biogenesis protein CcdA, partial [Rhodococcus qingshengii]|nr:cytochrome c biogenesis protein CcdA [Rhodococcus qingshengii]